MSANKNLNCLEARERLDRELDAPLEEQEATLLKIHLESCEACRAIQQSGHRMIDLLHRLPEEDAPDIAGKVMPVVRDMPRQRSRISRRPYIWIAAAACVVLICAGLYQTGLFSRRLDNKAVDEMDMVTPQLMSVERGEEKLSYDMQTSQEQYGGYDAGAGMVDDVAEYESQPMPETATAPQSAGVGITGVQSNTSNNASQNTLPYDNKIIRYASLEINSTAFDDDYRSLQNLVTATGGYIENSSFSATVQDSSRSAYLTVRVPQEQYAAFMQQALAIGQLRYQSESGQDVSSQYADTETRIKNLKIQEERLQTLMAKAESLTDIILLENEMTRIRYELESAEGTLKSWDNLVSFSTVNLSLIEVTEYIPVEPVNPGFGERMVQALKDGLANLVDFLEGTVLFLVSALPVLLILAAMIIVITLLFRRRRKA